MKKFIGLIVVLVATIYSSPNVYGQSEKISEELQKQSPIHVATEEMSSKNKFIKIDIQLPVVKGLADEEFQTKLNKKIKEQALKARHMILMSLQAELKMVEEEKRPFIPFELKIDYEITNRDDILSFQVTTYEFTGGAHGITGTDYYNIDLEKNKLLSLKDLFKKDSNYQEVITKEIKRQMKQQEAAGEGSYFHENDPYVSDAVFKSLAEDQSFYIKDGNLVIAFSQYEIAPGYMGQPTFSIPYELIKGMLKDEYMGLGANS